MSAIRGRGVGVSASRPAFGYLTAGTFVGGLVGLALADAIEFLGFMPPRHRWAYLYAYVTIVIGFLVVATSVSCIVDRMAQENSRAREGFNSICVALVILAILYLIVAPTLRLAD